MIRASPTMRMAAGALSAYEARGNKSSEANLPAAFSVCEKMRPHLATLVGSAGYRALLSRALVLAGAEIPWLSAIHVKADGSLDGLEEIQARLDLKETRAGAVVLVAQLLDLLVAFIGESLTLRLVREIWPKVRLNALDSGNGGKNEKTK